MTKYPITPPPELIEQWMQDHATKYDLARHAAQWAADQELEACCSIALTDPVCGTKHQRSMLVRHMRERRRPKPPSLKEQALEAARIELNPEGKNGSLIIRALEQLPDHDYQQSQ